MAHYCSSITVANGLVQALTLQPISTADVTGALGYTPLSGNQTITLSGDVTGSGTTSLAATLAASGVTAATYGDSTHYPVVTVDAKGRVTSASSQAANQGTVTSVALSLPAAVFTVSGSPVTGSGTLTGSLQTQSANLFLGGPASGPAATPTFRGLGVSDLPGDAFSNGVCNGRLTLTSGTPITTADVTGATTIYFTPYRGNRIALYVSPAWTIITFTETSLALGTLTNALPYDVFAYDNAGTLALELLAWSNTTTRATAVILTDGVYCKTGDPTRRYLGTFYTTSTTTTEDSAGKRYVFSHYNQVPKTLLSTDATSRTTSSTTYIQIGSVQVSYLSGLGESFLLLNLVTACADAGGVPIVAVGSATNTVATGCCLLATASSATVPLTAVLAEHPAAGAYTRYGIVKSGGGTAQINSNVAGGTDPCTSLSGTILC